MKIKLIEAKRKLTEVMMTSGAMKKDVEIMVDIMMEYDYRKNTFSGFSGESSENQEGWDFWMSLRVSGMISRVIIPRSVKTNFVVYICWKIPLPVMSTMTNKLTNMFRVERAVARFAELNSSLM